MSIGSIMGWLMVWVMGMSAVEIPMVSIPESRFYMIGFRLIQREPISTK